MHGIDSMAYFKASQKASRVQAQKAGEKKKESSADKPAAETQSVVAAEQMAGTEKKTEETETVSNNDSAEAASDNARAKPSESETKEVKDMDDTTTEETEITHTEENAVTAAEKTDAMSTENNTMCENADAADEKNENIGDVEGDAGKLDESESCKEKISDADEKVDEAGVTEENRTEAEKVSGDVAMDVDNVDVPQQQSSTGSAVEGQDSSQTGEEKANEDIEPMETDSGDRNNAVAVESGSLQQDDQSSSETQMEVADTACDEDTEKSPDKDNEDAATEEKEKAETEGSNTESTVKESETQNVGAGEGDNVEKRTDNDNVTEKVQQLDHSRNKIQAEQSASAQNSRQGNVPVQ